MLLWEKTYVNEFVNRNAFSKWQCAKENCDLCTTNYFIFQTFNSKKWIRWTRSHAYQFKRHLVWTLVDDSNTMVMVWDDFSCPKGLSVYSARNPSFISEPLTYENMKEVEDATATVWTL